MSTWPLAPDLGLMRCTFCGHEREDGAKLIQGPGVSICIECVCGLANLCLQDGTVQVEPGYITTWERPPNEEL